MSGYTSEEAVEAFDRCAVLCRQLGSRPEHLSAIIGSISFYLTRGEFSAARRVAEDLQSWVDTGNTYHRAESAAIFGALSFLEGDYREAGGLFDLAVDLFSSRPPSDHAERNWFLPHDVAVAALAHQAVIRWFTGRPREGQDAGERASARAATLGFPLGPFSMAYVKSYLGWTQNVVGDHECAERLASDVRDIGKRHGFPMWESNGEIHLALAQYGISGRADAADTVEQHASVWGLLGVRVFLPYFLTAAANTRAAMGQHAEALAGFTAAGQFVQETGLCFYEAERLRLLARALPSSGEEPLATLHQAWQLAHRQGALLFELRAALDLARLAAEPDWAERLDATMRRFPPGAAYPELREAQALLTQAPRRS